MLAGADPWKELAKAGLLQLGVPETTVLLTEIGRHAAPDSLKALATLMTGALPVARWGNATLRQELLPPIASGELTLTAAIREPSNPAPAIPATTVERDGEVGGGKITGTKIGVPYADQSHRPSRANRFHDRGSSGQIAPKLLMIMVLPPPESCLWLLGRQG